MNEIQKKMRGKRNKALGAIQALAFPHTFLNNCSYNIQEHTREN